MSTCFNLIFDIQDYWHIGNGHEGGAYADALALKDKESFPYIPGKSVKGLLREAFSIAEQNKWFGDAPTNLTSLLFGDEQRDGVSAQGMLQVSNAALPEMDKDDIRKVSGGLSHLYTPLTSTAIDPSSGVADQGSLRSIEVVVPMVLVAELSLNKHHPLLTQYPDITKNFQQWLHACLNLITHVGGKRHRGLGPVFVSAEKMTDEMTKEMKA